jgi:Asp-tRNA(Asn)/Glu-tRNA(Gln) amidotransferase A subunit family amidase
VIPERDRIQAVMTTEQIAAEMERGDYSAEMLLQHLIRHHNRLDRELAESAQSLDFQTQLNREVIELEKKTFAELTAERELADRLAGVLLSYHHDLLAGEDMQWLPEHDKSLAVWKEARSE